MLWLAPLAYIWYKFDRSTVDSISTCWQALALLSPRRLLEEQPHQLLPVHQPWEALCCALLLLHLLQRPIQQQVESKQPCYFHTTIFCGLLPDVRLLPSRQLLSTGGEAALLHSEGLTQGQDQNLRNSNFKSKYHQSQSWSVSKKHQNQSQSQSHSHSHITVNHSQSQSITVNHSQSQSITVNHSQSQSITVNHSQLQSITVNHSQSQSQSQSVTVTVTVRVTVTVSHSQSQSV